METHLGGLLSPAATFDRGTATLRVVERQGCWKKSVVAIFSLSLSLYLFASSESLYYAWESALFLAVATNRRDQGTRKEAQGKARKDGDAKKDETREKE